tara:strand:+ start:17 stop:1033 length:1017 start_codon:yes stop_codon:yes gene_type:complete
MLSAKLEEMENEDVKEEKEYMTKKEKREGDDRDADSKTEKRTEKMRKIKEENDMDLDEVLAELEKEVNEDARTDAEEEGYKDGLKDEKEDLMKEDDRTDAEEEGYEDGMEDEKEDLDDEEIDLEDMTDEDLKTFIEDVISDMVAAGEIEAGEDFEVEDEMDVDVDDEIDVEDDIDVTIDEDARTDAEEEGYKDGIKDEKADMKEQKDKMDEEMKEKNEELEEAYAAVKSLKNELNEINILNAKLLYTNKIFKSKNLSEHNKVKVLTSFDKAETVKEAKLIYETLKDGLASKTANKSMNESIGMASKSAGIGPKKVNAKPIVESNEMVDRFKKLAGIIS